MKRLVPILSALALCTVASAQIGSSGHLMYIGTLDKKLLVIDEDKEEVVGAIPLDGIPRTTVLSADTRSFTFSDANVVRDRGPGVSKVVSSFSLPILGAGRAIQASAPDRILVGSGCYSRLSGLAVDPTGRFLYTTMKVVIKDIDQYRIEPPQFVAIDLQDKKIAKLGRFPKISIRASDLMPPTRSRRTASCLYVFRTTFGLRPEHVPRVDRIRARPASLSGCFALPARGK